MAPRRKGVGNLQWPFPAHGCFCLGFDTQGGAYPPVPIIGHGAGNGNRRSSDKSHAKAKTAKGSFAPRARKQSPQASALRLCSPALRFALSTCR